jgi:hypothetical protein
VGRKWVFEVNFANNKLSTPARSPRKKIFPSNARGSDVITIAANSERERDEWMSMLSELVSDADRTVAALQSSKPSVQLEALQMLLTLEVRWNLCEKTRKVEISNVSFKTKDWPVVLAAQRPGAVVERVAFASQYPRCRSCNIQGPVCTIAIASNQGDNIVTVTDIGLCALVGRAIVNEC